MTGEFIEAGQLTLDTLNDLWSGQPVKGVIYNSITLSSSAPGIVDDHPMPSISRYASFYWPGGSPEARQSFETIDLHGLPDPSKAGAEISRVRSAILGAYVGRAALQRVPAELREAWRAAEAAAPFFVTQLSEMCKIFTVPLAVCITSDVTSGEQGRRIMHMFYPNVTHPAPVLEELQGVVRRGIQQEII